MESYGTGIWLVQSAGVNYWFPAERKAREFARRVSAQQHTRIKVAVKRSETDYPSLVYVANNGRGMVVR